MTSDYIGDIMNKYYYRYPGGHVYALEVYVNSIEEAKSKLRKEWDVKRLPNGFEIWK